MRKTPHISHFPLLRNLASGIIWIFLLLIVNVSCKEEEKEDLIVEGEDSHLYTPEVAALEEFNERIVDETWNVLNVTKSQADVSSDFSDFSILFTGSVSYRVGRIFGNFEAQNGSDIFPEQGLWTRYSGDPASRMYIENRLTECEFSEEDTHLKLTFSIPRSEESSEKEEYVFELTKAD